MIDMARININTFDLNLLVACEAMMQERNVTRAGACVGLSQPSMSNALSRMRTLCGDPLFVRTSKGMEPTPLAQMLGPPVRDGLAKLLAGLNQPFEFDPARSDRNFKLLMSDMGEVIYLPKLMRWVVEAAPQVSVRALQCPRGQYRNALESGEVDLAIGFLPALGAGFRQQRLFSDTYVCLVREDHPRIGKTLSLRQFKAESHVVIELSDSGQQGAATPLSSAALLERILSRKGIGRRTALRVPHFTVVPAIIQNTDLLVTVPSSVIDAMPGLRQVKALPLPFETPPLEVKQFWHQRYHHDPANRWLRGVIAQMMSERGPTLAPSSKGVK